MLNRSILLPSPKSRVSLRAEDGGFTARGLTRSVDGAGQMIQLTLNAPAAVIRVHIREPVALFRCSGEIDDGNIRWLEQPMVMAQELGIQRLEIDLREVTFIDGAVMKLLYRMTWTLPQGPTAIRVWVQPRFASLLRRVRLDQYLVIETVGPEHNRHRTAGGMPRERPNRTTHE